jgi:Tfp pilus assembly protein PilF
MRFAPNSMPGGASSRRISPAKRMAINRAGPPPHLGPDAARHREGSPTLPYGTMRVRPFLSQSVDINPESPVAHADLAVYFFTLVAMGLLRPTDGMPAARAAAQRAIDLAPAMPRAHAVSALVAGLYEHDWAEAARSFGRALHGNPDPWARYAYATWYLSPLGRHQEALTEVRRASVDDPLYLLGRVQVAMELCSIGHAQEGMHELELILAIDPRFGPALGLLGRECILRGRVDDAMTLAERTYAATPLIPMAWDFLRACSSEPATANAAASSSIRSGARLPGRFRGRAPNSSSRSPMSKRPSNRCPPPSSTAIPASGCFFTDRRDA